MVQSSAKGRRGEREVAGMCQNWWRKIDKKCEFKRTPLSGGWSTTTIRSHFRACGDIMTTSDNWPFTVEVKRREDWSLNNLFDGKPTAVWQWWIQSTDQANKEKQVPMLWLKRNRVPWLIMLPVIFIDASSSPKPDVYWTRITLANNGVLYGKLLPAIYIADRILKISPVKLLKHYYRSQINE